jgi:hypothetical protein
LTPVSPVYDLNVKVSDGALRETTMAVSPARSQVNAFSYRSHGDPSLIRSDGFIILTDVGREETRPIFTLKNLSPYVPGN